MVNMSIHEQAVELTQNLVRLDTRNPPGEEEKAARLLGDFLARAGLEVSYQPLETGRAGLAAVLSGDPSLEPLVFTGHLDTVPFGDAPWSSDPLGAEIVGGRLIGRGASDMKSGVAAAAVAAAHLAGEEPGPGSIVLVFTAGEETGSDGAHQMVQAGALPSKAGGLVVAEPTGNKPVLGHKGALWLECVARGKSSHGSMPHLGDNAIYKAAQAAAGLEDIFADAKPHDRLGLPTINVGTFHAGTKINMVPDLAKFQVDLRSVPGVDHKSLVERITARVGPEIEVSRLIDLPSILTAEDDPWVEWALGVAAEVWGGRREPGYENYFTDAAVLAEGLGGPPVLILGPGEAGQAHQTDEYCLVDNIGQAADFYLELARRWRRMGKI